MKIVNAEIKKMNITQIIAAHRPETIRHADRRIALTNGCFVEMPSLAHQIIAARSISSS